MNATQRSKSATHALVGLLLVAAALTAFLAPWQGDKHLHTVFETAATIVAGVVGTLGLVRYHARRRVPFLILGVGFLGTACLDAYHTVATSAWIDQLWPSPPTTLTPWSWFSSRLFLSLPLLGFWLAWDDADESRRIDEWMIYAAVGAVAAAAVLLYSLVPLPSAYVKFPLGRPLELVIAVVFMAAAIGCYRQGMWRTSVSHHWIIVSLILAAGTQVVMSTSRFLYDGPFEVAHLLKLASYLAVLIGFMADLFHLHKTAEADASRAALARAAADAAHAAAERRSTELTASEARYRALVEGAAVSLWDEDLTPLKRRLDRIQAGGVSDLRSYLAASPRLVADLAREIRVHAISDETLRMYNAESAEQLFASAEQVFGESYRNEFIDELVAVAEDRDSYEGEALTHSLDGRPVWVSKRVRIIRNDDSSVRAVMSLTDISSIKKAEDQLRARTGELARSNAELDDFAYIASHDLKEPLRGISNFAHFLLEDHGDELDEGAVEKVETLIRISGRMEQQIQSLLEYSRVARVEPSREDVDVDRVVEEVLDSLQGVPELGRTKIRIPTPLPTVPADRALTARIFHNLITNALKYSDKDERWIEIGWFDEGSGNESARTPTAPVFYVRDNGIGIREKHLNSVFRIFKRLHGRDQFGGGVGAGLTIVKKIVEAQDGRIWIESEHGIGTTFYFTITSGSMTAAPRGVLVGALAGE